MLPVTALFASILTLFYIKLALDVIKLRRSNRVSLGSGGVDTLEKAIRVHGNFAEYVPLGLVLMGLLETNGGYPWLVAVLGATLSVGRVLHARALLGQPGKLRVRGMQLTFGTLATLAVLNLLLVVRSHVGA